jgi:hypothetical protein
MSFSCLFSFSNEVEFAIWFAIRCLSFHGGGTMKKMLHNDLDTSILSSVLLYQDQCLKMWLYKSWQFATFEWRCKPLCLEWWTTKHVHLSVVTSRGEIPHMSCYNVAWLVRWFGTICVVLCFPHVWQWALSCWNYILQAWTCLIGQEYVGTLLFDIVVWEYDVFVPFVPTAFHSSRLIARVWIGAGTTYAASSEWTSRP